MLMDVLAATRELGVGQSTLRRWIREGRLPAVRLGRRVLLRPEALERFVRAAERPPGPPKRGCLKQQAPAAQARQPGQEKNL